MRTNEYKNELTQNLQYWNDVSKAKLPEKACQDLIPPLTEKEKQNLPVSIRNFYHYGQWFFNFVANVVIPYNRLLLLYSRRHISALFKSFIVYDEHDIEMPSIGEMFDLLSTIPMDSAKDLCRSIAEDSDEIDLMLSCVENDDRQGFYNCCSRLEVSELTLKAVAKTANTLKQFDFCKFTSEIGDSSIDESSFRFILKEHITKTYSEVEVGKGVTDFTLNLISDFFSLAEDKSDKMIQERIENEYGSEVWVILAKRFFCMSVYQMRRIWYDLSQEEKDIADEVLNPSTEMVFIKDGQSVNLNNYIIKLSLRWSKISRARILERDKSISREKVPITNSDNVPSNFNFRECFVSQSPKIEYSQMRAIAWALAGKVQMGNSITSSETFYIKEHDVLRLCYFFLKRIESPDDSSNIDFTNPIIWEGNWQSYWYFVLCLYGHRNIPDGVKENSVNNFRFLGNKRQRCQEKGKITKTTLNNYKESQVTDKDIKQINKMLKSYLMTR